MEEEYRGVIGRTTVLVEEDELQAHPIRTFSIDRGILHCVAGPHTGLQIPLRNEQMLLGRDPLCDICLEFDDKSSRYHCEIRLAEEGVVLRDLGSRNGTFVDYAKVKEGILAPHNKLRIGDSVFVLETRPGDRQSITVRYFDKSNTLVGKSPKMRRIFAMLERLGSAEVSVLLAGETGTGKSSIAQALHQQSARSNQPFITVNCGALSPQLVESALFGYEKGAFTGADKRHIGFFEQANGGTLFLDEIGELPLDLQPKLLDVLERKCIRRLGGESEVSVDFRLITATHMEFKEAIAEKYFREDLYYRIAVVELLVPSLRERLEDLSLLVNHMIDSIHGEQLSEPPQLTVGALQKMKRYVWPGNVRELRNVLERSLLFLEGPQLEADDVLLPEVEQITVPPTHADISDASHSTAWNELTIDSELSLDQQLQYVERKILLQTLERYNWNIIDVFKALDISRSGLYRRMQRLGIKRR